MLFTFVINIVLISCKVNKFSCHFQPFYVEKPIENPLIEYL